MTTYAFTMSQELKKHWYPFNIIEDMWADIRHMVGLESSNCTVSDNDHSLRGHLADLVVDALRLLPAAVIVALVIAGFMVLPVFGTNGNQPNTEPVSNPVIVPPASNADESLVWPATPTMTPEPTLTPSPTVTPTLTTTPVVFVSEEECDSLQPVGADDTRADQASSSLSLFLTEKEFLGERRLFQVKKENWLTLAANKSKTPGIKGAYALERAEWEPFLDSNRYCLVEGQWMPLPPYEDLRLLNSYIWWED